MEPSKLLEQINGKFQFEAEVQREYLLTAKNS